MNCTHNKNVFFRVTISILDATRAATIQDLKNPWCSVGAGGAYDERRKVGTLMLVLQLTH
jgi:hypothetical protein